MKQVEITTARNVDYSRLQKYLQSKDWQGSDRETYLRMLDVAGTLPTVERGYNFDVSLDAALTRCGI